MDLHSCENCGIVINVKKVKMIPMDVPDDPKETETDEDGYLITEDTHYNDDIVWEDHSPLETWSCPVCKEFNGISKED